MKLIESKAELIQQKGGLEGLYRHIETCGRVPYKSEAKSDGTIECAKAFVEKMIKSRHNAVLEHGTVYLKFFGEYEPRRYKYIDNPYSKVVAGEENINKVSTAVWYVTSNYRVLVENGWLDDLQYLCSPTEFHEKRYTIRFKGDIHLYKDSTRHRVMSYAIESTRFCNYMKEKFGMSVSFMQPTWLKDEFVEEFEKDCKTLENIYFKWIKKGLRAEEAAYFLCQGTAAEFCITGFASDWRFFMDLRLFEKTGKVHPDMKDLMQKAQRAMQEAGIWNDIMSYPSKFDE